METWVQTTFMVQMLTILSTVIMQIQMQTLSELKILREATTSLKAMTVMMAYTEAQAMMSFKVMRALIP